MGAVTTTLAEEEARELRRLGLNAVCWDCGGGTQGVGIAPGGTQPDYLRFYFGTAADTWAGEVLDDDGNVVGGIVTSVNSASQDLQVIAAGILDGLADLARTGGV